MYFLRHFNINLYVQDVPLPSFNWTRIINETHGIIRAVIDSTNGKPKPTSVTAYQAWTSDTLRLI
jgi:hypothetical protein